MPCKIEQDGYGNLLLSPGSNEHGDYQVEIAALLGELMGSGRTIAESSVPTPRGVKVPGVAWHSEEFGEQQGNATPFARAP